MKRTRAALVTTLFFFLAPGVVAALIPWWITRWRPARPPWDPPLLRGPGVLLIALGIGGLLECFARFVREGRGTPAPLYPTETLVVTGLYRRVRNPMYVAILAILIGQALWLGSVSLLIYAAGAWIVTNLFVRLYEEPTLQRTYGSQYDIYRANVPRWWPRLRPWSPGP